MGAVENLIERVAASIGAILASNAGNSHKLGWSRSSRTDKGVHSTSTVVAFKMETAPGVFEVDVEGSGLAAAFNQNLPKEVRVFSIQRVNKSFHARSKCKHRTYKYFVPAHVLDFTGTAEDDIKLERMKECLRLFHGMHAFHNYTQRRRYRPKAKQREKRTMQEIWEKHSIAQSSQKYSGSADRNSRRTSGFLSLIGREGSMPLYRPKRIPAFLNLREMPIADIPFGCPRYPIISHLRSVWLRLQNLGTRNGTPEGNDAASTREINLKFWWMHEPSSLDVIGDAHYRRILEAFVEGPMTLVPEGEPCLCITFKGASFMVHQIRHLVAAAVCVVRGKLPLEFVEASLCEHVRGCLPRAPPSTLVLEDCEFFDFPSPGGRTHPLLDTTGSCLALRGQGQAARQEFCREVLHPAVDELLRDDSWASWSSRLDWETEHSSEEMGQLLETFRSWKQRRDLKKSQRDAEKSGKD